MSSPIFLQLFEMNPISPCPLAPSMLPAAAARVVGTPSAAQTPLAPHKRALAQQGRTGPSARAARPSPSEARFESARPGRLPFRARAARAERGTSSPPSRADRPRPSPSSKSAISSSGPGAPRSDARRRHRVIVRATARVISESAIVRAISSEPISASGHGPPQPAPPSSASSCRRSGPPPPSRPTPTPRPHRHRPAAAQPRLP